MDTEFVKLIDDLVRQELLILGYDYDEVVLSVEEAKGGVGATVRLRAPYEDVSFDPPQAGIEPETFSAFVRRRLMTKLQAPERAPAEEE